MDKSAEDDPAENVRRRVEPGTPPLWREVAGAELRRRRHEAGRTLADVAAQSGVSTAYLSEIERGRKEPSSEMLDAVAGALGMGLVDLTCAVAKTLVTDIRSRQRGLQASAISPVLLAA